MPNLSASPKHQKRLLSGMRPTGRLHLGNYVGALENWVRLQHEYASHFFVADWHTLTTDYKHTRAIPENTVEMVTDWLAAGLVPEKSPIFVQSQVKQHAELHLLLSMLITKARLERNPTLKEQVRELALDVGDAGITLGHLSYPVLQAADILMYRGEVVPVGEDQLPHIEISRELARRFNNEFAANHPVFPEPEGLLTAFARLPGLDGNRMSKSVGNTILLSDPPEQIQKSMRTAITDPQKIRRGDPGRPDICLVFTYHQKFNPNEIVEIRSGCESGALGCVECKQRCATSIIRHLAPFQEKRVHFAEHPDEVTGIIRGGTERARRVAAETMDAVHEAMGFG